VNRRAKRGERGGQPPLVVGLVLRSLGEAEQVTLRDFWDAALGSQSTNSHRKVVTLRSTVVRWQANFSGGTLAVAWSSREKHNALR
jgi:hypothetical protein